MAGDISENADMTRGQNQPQLKGANSLKRNALGRGLSALMSATAVNVAVREVKLPGESEREAAPKFNKFEAEEASAPAAESDERSIVYLPVDCVTPNGSQPRKAFRPEELETLTQSIRDTGLLQPIIVRRKETHDGQRPEYEVVAGERRWRASQAAGLKEIPAIVRRLSDKEAFALAIIENVQRADLNPIEEALAYQRLIDEFGDTQAAVAATVGKDRVSIANALRLLKLDSSLQEKISAGVLSAGHGRALLMLESNEQREALAKRIVSEGLSVRSAEKFAAEMLHGKQERAARAPEPKVQREKSPAMQAVEERLRRALGTKVSVTLTTEGAGELRISFFSEGELENILERLNA